MSYDADMKTKRIYLDHAAATPIHPEVLKILVSAARKYTGNAHGLHAEGHASRQALEQARANIAKVLVVHPDEVVFTSGATEANNIAIVGVVRAARAAGIQNPRIIVSAIEHPSVLETARALAHEGVIVDEVGVDYRGLVDPHALRRLIQPETVLISVMYANNEIGTVEPICEIAKEVRHARASNASPYPYFHTDAAQAANYLELNTSMLGVDLMTISSGKTYGPYGVGALWVKRGVQIDPLSHGGSHEGGRRPGTEAVPLLLAFAFALGIAQEMKTKEIARVGKLRDVLAAKILKKIPEVMVNGELAGVLPNILSLTVLGVESEALVIYLDAAGIAVSGRSACATSVGGASYVILALGKGTEELSGTIRFSLGRETTREGVEYVAKEFARIVPFLRGIKTRSDI